MSLELAHRVTSQQHSVWSLSGGIVLQKSKVVELRIFAKNPNREAIADSYNLEVAYEFNARR
jgi:hypothetical protein